LRPGDMLATTDGLSPIPVYG